MITETKTEQKYFSPEQATRSLAIVSPIVRDIIQKRKKMIGIKRTIRAIEEGRIAVSEEYKNNLPIELRETSKEITYNLEELEMIGCIITDFALGVVRFPSIIQDRVVFLCWTYGEKQVAYFHELTKDESSKKVIMAV